MFKNALIYRIDQWEAPAWAEAEARLGGSRFVECGATQQQSAGWVEPRGEKHGVLLESVGGQWILKLCTETKAVPGPVVKTQLEERLQKIEQQTGRRPKGKMAKELKEEIVHELLPRAFPKRSTTLVWLDPAGRRVLVGAASAKKADGVVTQLVELLGGGLMLSPLQTEMSPATAMAAWLSDKEAPAGFSLDRECELKQPDSEKAAVRYARHTLEIDEVGEHIKQGKLPTQLAMTWNGRVSFVLTETLALKKIKLLDVVLEGAGSTAGDKADNGFDTDVAITTGELSQLIPALIEALGGALDRDQPVPSAAAVAKPSTPATPVASDETPPWEVAPA
jgi:recombination associated protein RdgC